jgi:hypothetical protein
MAEHETNALLLAVIAIVAAVGLGFSLASVATNESMNRMMGGGGMMDGTTSATSTPGGLEWGVLLVSAAFLVIAILLLFRAREIRARVPSAIVPAAEPTMPAEVGPSPGVVPDPARMSTGAPGAAAVPEPTLIKLLDADERRMYLELRDHGGQMLQRDLVALGIFSKAKVTRVLDKLEAKGLIVREAHGMTNRVRFVHPPAK